MNIEVDLDALTLLSQHIKASGREVLSLGAGLPTDASGGLGQQVVEDALEDFLSVWAYGRSVISDDLTAADVLVCSSLAAYRAVEASIAGATSGGDPSA